MYLRVKVRSKNFRTMWNRPGSEILMKPQPFDVQGKIFFFVVLHFFLENFIPRLIPPQSHELFGAALKISLTKI